MVLRRDRSETGFSLIELLMVAAIILIIGAMAIPGLVRARSSAGEASAVSTLRVLFQAEGRYANLFDNSYSPDLNSLGAPKPGDNISSTAADLVDDILAGRLAGKPSQFIKSGYVFIYTPIGTFPMIRDYTIAADPTARGTTGSRSYLMNQTGLIRFNSNAPATLSDDPLR